MSLKKAGIAAGLMAGLISSSAFATPITYTFSGDATGYYDQSDFQNAAFTLSIKSDTSKVAPYSGCCDVTLNTGNVYLTVAGAVTNGQVLPLSYNGPISPLGTVFVNSATQTVGLTFNNGGGFDAGSPSVANYNLKTNFDPVSVSVSNLSLQDNYISVNNYETNIQTVSNVKFSAALSTVPLPASAPMFGAALVALGVIGYGVKRKANPSAA